MVLPLQSRFAVLSVDDDEDRVRKNVVKNQKKKTDNKAGPGGNQKQDLKKKPQKKKEGQLNQNQNQNQNANKAKQTKSTTQKKKKTAAVDQWEQWKEKDAQLVDGNYESELHQAILLSKLDYEEKKDVYEQMRKEQEVEKKTAAAKKKKSNKTQTMSLSEFNNLPDSLVKQDAAGGDCDTNINGQHDPDPEFFERIRQDAKKAFSSEQAAEKRRVREPFVNDAITIAKYEDQLERRDKEISELKLEITRLKEELHNVKTRNKTLCQILGQGEMRDKAEVLVQMEKTQKVKDELSSEVEKLHALLEQERSKVRMLTADKNNKGKSKKKESK